MIGSQINLSQPCEMTQLRRELLQFIINHTEMLKPPQTDRKDWLVLMSLTEKYIILHQKQKATKITVQPRIKLVLDYRP